MEQDLKSEELTALVNEIRERVRARYPSGVAGNGVVLPDLMPVLHARDAAGAKVAAIGTVNPRPPGFVNDAMQAVKRFFARLLDWHVRDQVEFNRGAIAAVEALMEAMNENNRALAQLASQVATAQEKADAAYVEGQKANSEALLAAQAADAAKDGISAVAEPLENRARELHAEARELKDVRTHWAQWRSEWERKLSVNEVQFLRAVADLETSFAHRATLMETNFRDIVKAQHTDYLGALDRSGLDIQKRLWADLEKVRAEFERLIHVELRLIRQRAASAPASAPAAAQAATQLSAQSPAPGGALAIDYEAFAARFRGTEEEVREKQRLYVPLFTDRTAVLDIGCGRGEFLEVMREAGVQARGIDLNESSVAVCRAKGLDVELADLFAHLRSLPDETLDGVFSAQVVEHIPPFLLPEMIRLAAAKLERGGVLAIETPNPECLAIFASHFYRDPTHERPVPSQLLAFYMEESGLSEIEVRPLSPAIESMPALGEIPKEFREAFFGGLDYAIVGRKLR